MKIDIKKQYILDYITGKSNYDAIEKEIDPTRYEIFDCGIYDNKTKKLIPQSAEYEEYCRQVSVARKEFSLLGEAEIIHLVDSIFAVAPTEIELDD